MRKYNLIAVYDAPREKILMCLRRKEPYKGLLNLVGGKIEPGEDGLSAAYRELFEETGIARAQITLAHVIDFTYHLSGISLEVYAGSLGERVQVSGQENELLWVDLKENFFDTARFAGMGNIGHILLEIANQEGVGV